MSRQIITAEVLCCRQVAQEEGLKPGQALTGGKAERAFVDAGLHEDGKVAKLGPQDGVKVLVTLPLILAERFVAVHDEKEV